jgi:hypothetical protein
MIGSIFMQVLTWGAVSAAKLDLWSALERYLDGSSCNLEDIERFAELFEAKVRADEREACAKVIENDCHDDMTRAEEAAAIRARSEK